MRLALALLLLLPLIYASDCISCDELQDTPPARLSMLIDDEAKVVEVNVYYENLSAEVTRQPITDSVMLIELTNSSGLQVLYKTYTDSEGKAKFDFTQWSKGCANIKALYCPFCTPASPTCGFAACLNYSRIDTAYTSAEDVPEGPGGNDAPGTLNPARYLPATDQKPYCPPPPPMGATPALCLPLLLIFSLLSGALFLTGKNPWAGFNIGGARVGRHIRYQARGRGFALDLKSAAMSIASAAKEMQTNPETGKKYGEEAKPQYFGYSMVDRLGKVVKGGSGWVASATSLQTTAGGGARGYKGIRGAFAQAGRDARASTVRVFGGRVDKDGKAVGLSGKGAEGRAFGAGEVVKQWGTEFGLGLARLGAAIWDSTFLAQMTSLYAGTALERSISSSQRETRTRAIAEAELLTDRYGRDIRDMGTGFRAGDERVHTDEDGSRTGRAGSRFVELDASGLGLAEGTRVVATVNNVGENGDSTITLHLSSGEGANARLTNYRLQNGVVTGFEQVMRPGTTEQIGVNFRMGPGGTVEAAGITNYVGPSGEPRFMEVQRDGQGRISQVGDIVIQRDGTGAVTGMFDQGLPAAQRGQPGQQVGQGSAMYDAVNNLMNSDGRNYASMSGVIALNESNMREIAQRTMGTVNQSLERTRQVYMEQFGLVQVTDRNLLNVDASGAALTEPRGDYSIRVMDGSYSPSGEAVSRGIGAGTTIDVNNGQYTRITNASGGEIALESRPAAGSRFETVIAGTNVVLNTGSQLDRDAGAVRTHMAEFGTYLNNASQAYGAYQNVMMQEAGRQFRESRPELFQALESGLVSRQQVSEEFNQRIRAGGASDDVGRAAGLLFASTQPGYAELDFATAAERARREFEPAYSRSLHTGQEVDARSLSPAAAAYAQAYDAVASSGIDPRSDAGRERIEAMIRPTLHQYDRDVHTVVTNLASSDQAVRGQALNRAQELGLIPRDYTARPGEDLSALAVRTYMGESDSSRTAVLGDRVHDSVGGTMARHPELVVRGSEEDSGVARSAASSLLSLGTGISGMSDSEIRARAQESIYRNPNISPEDRQEALSYVDSYIPRAREVARDFSAAESLVAREVSHNYSYYARSDTDMSYASMFGEQHMQGRREFTPQPAPAAGSPEAQRFEGGGAPSLGTPEGQAEWTRQQEEQTRAARYSFIADTSRTMADATAEARQTLGPRASESDVRDYALGRLVTGYAERYNSTPPGGEPYNPLALDTHSVFLGTAASGLRDANMEDLGRMSRGGSGDISSPEYTRHIPERGFDPMAISGYVVGTSTISASSSAYGGEIPSTAYEQGRRGILDANAGRYDSAATSLLSGSRSAAAYIEERRRREMQESGI